MSPIVLLCPVCVLNSQAHACLAEVAAATLKEPGAKIYRFYKTDGKDEFVCMEK